MKISIIIPVLNESALLQQQLAKLEPFRNLGNEVIVVDGGSDDGSGELARPLADQVCHTSTGRSLQMNYGAGMASGEVLLFLHIDTCLPADFALY